MLYLVKISVYAALMYAVYLLFLKNRASFSLSRLYLVACAVLPLALPFVSIPAIAKITPAGIAALQVQLPQFVISSQDTPATKSILGVGSLLLIIYLLGVVFMLLRMSLQFIKLMRFTRRHAYTIVQGAKVYSGTQQGPGSFGNYIFLPGDDTDPVIVAHELAHIRLRHSADLLLFRVLQALLWPDVMLYIIAAELKLVHEFQADVYAAGDMQAYTQALLNEAFYTNQFSLAHTFFHHPLKRRIAMLHRSPLSRTQLRITMLGTAFSAIFLLSAIIYLQSCKQQPVAVSQGNNKGDSLLRKALEHASPSTGKLINATNNFDGKAYAFVDNMPEASFDLVDYLQKTIVYPQEAKKKGISGRVIVKFIVNEEGHVIEPVVVRSVDPALDKEALRAVSQMPVWTPGKKDGKNVPVYFTLPISFQLQ